MRKIPLISACIIVVILFVVGSLTNVVGYHMVQSSNQNSIRYDIDQKELLFQTILNLTNNKEIQSIIQKSEINGSPIRFQQLFGRLQKYIIDSIEKNEVLNEKLMQLSNLPCDCEKDKTTRLWHFPVICTLLFPLFIFSLFLSLYFKYVEPVRIMLLIGFTLDCFWTHW